MVKLTCLMTAALISFASFASVPAKVLIDLEALQALGLPALEQDSTLGVALAKLTPEQQSRVLEFNHTKGKCGGFEVLDETLALHASNPLKALRARVEKDFLASAFASSVLLPKRSSIEAAMNELKADNLRDWVIWLSSFPNRDNREADPNVHVHQLKERIENLTASYAFAEVELVSHNRTRQQSLKVHLQGSQRPDEIIVLGGHLDSINNGWGSRHAPGADDNASGSSNLLETLRVFIQQGQPQRSVEFIWYAGEESGLLGSAEIAQGYKNQNKDVVAVLQLDMTLHPGSGELTLASITDFTSPWLREMLVQINNHYIGARIIEDRCGYACSDHASWYRQGYSTLLPFEAATRSMNRKIHTTQDVINENSSFEHSLAFSKIALAFAMELGNSQLKSP